MIADAVRQSCALAGGGLHLEPGSHAAACNLGALQLCLAGRTATRRGSTVAAAAASAEGGCRAATDELAHLFNRQSLEQGTGFVC